MPKPTKAEKRAYARKLLQIERRFGLLERDTLSRSIVMMRNFRGWIAAQLTEIDNFEQFRLRELQANIEQLILQYEGQLRSLSNGAVRGSFNLGRLSVVEPLESAGITNLFFRPSPAQVNVLLDFSADLITGIGLDMRKKINTQISLAALGGKSPFQAMKDITKIIGLPAKASDPVKGISYQAERIMRTEVNRAYSLASFSQQRDLAEQVPGLQKMWRATGDPRTRTSHLLAHGQIVLVNDPFIIGEDRDELMHPLDPAGSAAETINCRCKSITVFPEIGPIRSPLDDKIEAERARREKEKAVKAEKARRTKRPKDIRDIQQSLINSGSYNQTGDGYQLRTRVRDNDILPTAFNPDEETRIAQHVTERYRDLVRSEDGRELLAQLDEDGHMMSDNQQDTTVGIIYTSDAKDVGMGSGGRRSAKVFWAPYTMGNRADALGSSFIHTLQVDPIYVLNHELHHAYGSLSEFDILSDAMAIDSHYSLGNRFIPDTVNFQMEAMLYHSMNRATGNLKDYILQSRKAVKWLTSNHPEARAIVDQFSDSKAIWKRINRW